MLYEEIVIGFDVREMWLSFDERWTPDHTQHLIRQDIEKPLAFDRMIWPSIFVPNFMIVGGTGFEKIPDVVVNLEIPVQYRSYEGFWNDLSSMRDYLTQNPAYLRKPRWVIAITELLSGQDRQELLDQGYRVKPYELDTRWTFLGYDVCYDYLWSAVYLFYGDDLPQLQVQYVASLNQYHLFINQEQAELFAQWVDQDPGHAPHSIHGIYYIESQGGATSPT